MEKANKFDDVVTVLRKRTGPIALAYNDIPELALAVTAIPKVGGFINSYLNALSSYYTARKLECVIRWLEEIEKLIPQVQIYEAFYSYIRSKDFEDLFFLIWYKVHRGIREYKLKYLTQLLFAGILLGDRYDFDKAEEFAETVDSMSYDEMRFLHLVHEYFKANPTHVSFGEGTLYNLLGSKSELTKYKDVFSKELLIANGVKMTRFGLWFEQSGAIPRSRIHPNWHDFEKTPLFDLFLEYIGDIRS